MPEKILVGGQAVIEGVLMRVPGAYATALRLPNGSITVQRQEFQSLTERYPLLKMPILRGVIALYESLKIGLNALQMSGDLSQPPAEKQASDNNQNFQTRLVSGLTLLLAMALGVGLFAYLPLLLTTRLLAIERQALAFNLVTGFWRVGFFMMYLWLISLMKDIQRVFQYHGAEHKVIYAFENGYELTLDNVRPFSTHHPRCGTSFIFIVLLVSILLYALIDTGIMWVSGTINLQLRLIFHLLLLPIVAGIGYEFLKITSRFRKHWLARGLSAPGLWLQRITTKPPDDQQLEVSIAALKGAFGERYAEFAGRRYSAEAVA
jgi:uncharacterized protein YqhQ